MKSPLDTALGFGRFYTFDGSVESCLRSKDRARLDRYNSRLLPSSRSGRYPITRAIGLHLKSFSTLSGFFLPLHLNRLKQFSASCRVFEHSARQVSWVRFLTPEMYGLGRNDGLQAVSCNSVKSVQLKVTLTELKKQRHCCSSRLNCG